MALRVIERKPQVVVVTGASAGVGRAIVRAFAKRGARIGLLARGRDGLEAARKEVESLGGEALSVSTDVADYHDVDTAASAVEDAFGPIDVWVNNAMATVFAPIRKLSPDEFRRVTDVTYHGVVHGTMVALQRMLPRNRGVIVQVGSALAFRGLPLQAAYCGAKHAIQGFTEALRSELIHDGSDVRVTTVHLPAINTPQFSWGRSLMPRRAQPVPPIYQPELAAEAVLWAAAHPRRRELNVGWSTAATIWMSRLAPGLADRFLARRGVEGQLTQEPEDPDRRHNLWQPLAGDYGAHGRFDRVAHRHSTQLWATTHRGSLALAAAGLAGLLLAGRAAVRR
jgi:NAD(P)-dependent dehydrogenase (short-subunit alcohol dehydrogenase family)